jgi:hypothetical protein
MRNVMLTLRDVMIVRHRIFSERYHLPRDRERSDG